MNEPMKRTFRNSMWSRVASSARLGFTLIELLLVVTILGIVLALTMPNMASAMAGNRLRVGSRSIMQCGRYAHTMAIAHQKPVAMVLDLDAGVVRVDWAANYKRPVVVADEEQVDDERKKSLLMQPAGFGEEQKTPRSSGLNEVILKEWKLDELTLSFQGFQDDQENNSREDGLVELIYRSNGICRPYIIRVEHSGDWVDVEVDVVGSVRSIRRED